MIPKIIHYCWFGRNPKPLLAEKCIKSWKKYCRNYEIIEWNEDNYDLSQAPLYVRQAYDAKKWAFVTDYVRLQVVYEYGGIYVDTDVEFRKKPDALLSHQAYFGFESKEYVATGLGFGAVKGCPLVKELMDDYQNRSFVLEDDTYDLTPCPVINKDVFLRHGLRQDGSLQMLDGDVVILPQEYLSPINNGSEGIVCTENTVSIHWFSTSWGTEEEQRSREEYHNWMEKKRLFEFLSRTGRQILGERLYLKLKDIVKDII